MLSEPLGARTIPLLDPDVPRDGAHVQQEAAVADLALELMPAEGALHGHLACGVDVSGNGVRVERESRLPGQAHGDVAGSRREPPGAFALAPHQDVAAGGLGAHGSFTGLDGVKFLAGLGLLIRWIFR